MSLIYKKFASTLQDHNHRPFPLSEQPWVMNQRWSNLLFAHWQFSADVVRKLVPACFDLDLYDGQAYIGVVPFYMSEVSPRYLPSLPWLSYFPELNVRTYVSYKGQPGVYFFSLDAANFVAVYLARTLYKLPYYNAVMSITEKQGKFDYTSRRIANQMSLSPEPTPVGEADLVVSYCGKGSVFKSKSGSLEHFLTERYCLFTEFAGKVYRGEIHHRQWPLQQAEADFKVNSMLSPLGLEPQGEPHLLFTEGVDTVEWAIALV
ncbi:MAG: DUF2071 domain-containing protein [Candidatus Melainabacteria bacterium]|nr:DUF2071 domain-containing protein [Candidatus Melainabacteria bacterium]